MRSNPVEGRLELVFARRGARTTLAHAHARAPLKIVRPFPLDGGRQLVQILTLGPGICAGDAYAIDVTVEPGASAVVITQSASRIHRMPDGSRGTQTVTLTVRSGGHLEYYPGLTIPFPGSEFAQTIDVAVEAGGRFGLLECWAMGRVGRGEYLRFRALSSRTEVMVDRVPAYADTLHLDPRAIDLAGHGLLEKHRYLASGYWYGAEVPASRGNGGGVLSALGETSPGHAYFRALAMDSPALGRALGDAVKQVYRSWNLQTAPVPRFAC
ncbi:MAG: urease accessory protein UreD [Vicinamibacterales bacterium]